jgi:hypothetical protein
MKMCASNFTARFDCSQAILDCGEKRSATPLSHARDASNIFRRFVHAKSGVAAVLCHPLWRQAYLPAVESGILPPGKNARRFDGVRFVPAPAPGASPFPPGWEARLYGRQGCLPPPSLE